MKFLRKCEGCRGKRFPEDRERRSFLIKKRKYDTIHGGVITSQKDLCRECYKNTKLMLGEEIKK